MVNVKKKKQMKSNQPKTRKEVRKEQRKMKKQRRLEYYTNRSKPGKFVLRQPDQKEATDNQIPSTTVKEPPKKRNKEQFSGFLNEKFSSVEKEKREQRMLEKDMQKRRNKQLKESNADEDRNIKQLEKQLKLNKRKTKSIPKSFVSDGLDYLLELCDGDSMNAIATAPEIDDSHGEFDEDFALMTDNRLEETNVHKTDFNNESKLQSNIRDNTDSTLDINKITEDSPGSNNSDIDYNLNRSKSKNSKKRKYSESNDSENGEENLSDDGSDNNLCGENSSDGSSSSNNINDTTWEDIYGRVRGTDGSVINNNEGKYIPPAVRAKMESQFSIDDKQIEKLTRLKRQIKGHLNRLTEANMHSICTHIEELYMNNSRNDMSDTITNLILELLVSQVITNERLLLEQVLLITILHANVGTEVGAHFLHAVVKEFNILFNSDLEVEDKKLDNTVCIISQLYNFKIFHSNLLYQLLSKLSDRFDEKSVECILSILKNVGFSLRKDNPLALKELIIQLQKKASDAPKETKENSRIKYMLDILLAIKNNNMSKIPNFDTSYSEHLKKLQKNFIRKGNYVTQLNISLEDLLEADVRGRWWIVGSAWSGAKEVNLNKDDIKTETYSQKLLDLARKQRMNTDTRRNIFCIIMSAEDYLDAFEKLLHLGLKNQQEREIIHVILHCCLQEKKFNTYYAVLAQKFCVHDRKYQMIIKYSIWDKLKTLTECSTSQISNLAKLLTHLFLEKGLSISTLKIVQFGELDKISLRFMRQILLGILLFDNLDTCTGVFENVAQSEKLTMFRESLRLFIRHFLLKNLKTEKVAVEQKVLLRDRCDIIEKMLSFSDKRIKF